MFKGKNHRKCNQTLTVIFAWFIFILTVRSVCSSSLNRKVDVDGRLTKSHDHRSKRTSDERNSVKSKVDKVTFMREVSQRDDRYVEFLRKTILNTFRLRSAPDREQAKQWRRRSDLGAIYRLHNRSTSSSFFSASAGSAGAQRRNGAATTVNGMDESSAQAPMLRKYSVNVVGTLASARQSASSDGQHISSDRRAHHRRRKNRHQGRRDAVTKACILTYHFNVALLSRGPVDDQGTPPFDDHSVETTVDRADFSLQLRHPQRFVANHRKDAVKGQEDSETELLRAIQYDDENDPLHQADQFLFQGVDLLWPTSDDVMNAIDDAGNEDWITKSVDVTFLFEPLWSVDRGANITATSVIRYHTNRSDEKYNHQNSSRYCQNLRPPSPILRLQLEESIKRNVKSKRHSDQSDHKSRKNKRQPEDIIDCETQWDSAFFNTINDSFYDHIMPCCRRKIRINFSDLGWDSWVVSPRSFDAYYCIGRCLSFGSGQSDRRETVGKALHQMPLADDPPRRATTDAPRPIDGSALYAEMMNGRREGGALSLAPCCTPIKYAPISIRVLTGVNEEVTQVLDNLIVRKCGCM